MTSVIATEFNTHSQQIEEVFQRLSQSEAKALHVRAPQVRYLGHVVGAEGVATDPEKIQKVPQWMIPRGPSSS